MKTARMLGVMVAILLAGRTAESQVTNVTLDACIRAALQANPGVDAARQRAAGAAAAVQQARAAYYPMVRSSATVTRTDNPPQAFMMTLNQRDLSLDTDFNQPEDTENLRLGLEARYRLYDAGRRGLDQDAAGLAGEAGVAQLRAAQNDLIHQVTRAYYEVLEAQAMVGVQDTAVRSLAESRRVAEARLAAGAATRGDVLALDVRLAEAREDLLRASNGVRIAGAVLGVAMGQPLTAGAVLATPAAATVHAPAGTNAAPFDASVIEGRPEWEAARLSAAAQQRHWLRTRRDYAPNFNAFGTLDWDSDVSADFESSYLVGVMADWDVFTGFQRGGSTRQAQANWRAARAEQESVRNHLALDLETAILREGEARARVDVTREGLASAEEALRLTRARYEQGAAQIAELLQAEAAVSAMGMRQLAAQYDGSLAQSDVARARGDLVRTYVDTEAELAP